MSERGWNWVEEAMLARLRQALPPGVFVESKSDIEAALEDAQRTPAVYVVPLSYQPEVEAGWGEAQGITQTITTIVAVRNVRDLAGGGAARTEAGTLAAKTHLALSGWLPGPQATEVEWIKSPAAMPRNGFLYQPLLWRLTFF